MERWCEYLSLLDVLQTLPKERVCLLAHGQKVIVSKVVSAAKALSNEISRRLTRRSSQVNVTCGVNRPWETQKHVVVFLESSVSYVVSLLAVSAAGAAFVLVDPSWPPGKIEAIIADCTPELILTTPALLPILQEAMRTAAQQSVHLICGESGETDGKYAGTSWSSEKIHTTIPSNDGNSSLLFVSAQSSPNQHSDQPSPEKNLQSQLPGPNDDTASFRELSFSSISSCTAYAYVLYTSGSTGQPKGVCGTLPGLLKRLCWMADTSPYQPDDVCCFKTGIGFIDHLTELLGPMLAGVPVVIPPAKLMQDNPLAMLDFIQEHSVTRLVAVPSLLRILLSSSNVSKRLASLRLVVSSGEALSWEPAQRLQDALPRATLLNLYGSTEVTGDVLCLDVTKYLSAGGMTSASSTVPIGRPILDHRAMLIDEDLEEISTVGKGGELCVAGPGLCSGYLNQPEASARAFIHRPIDREAARAPSDAARLERWYRTGDLAMQLPDGNYVWIGRKDRQLKIRGHRVQLEEVEAAIRGCPRVRSAAVKVWATRGRECALAAYVVLRGLDGTDVEKRAADRETSRLSAGTDADSKRQTPKEAGIDGLEPRGVSSVEDQAGVQPGETTGSTEAVLSVERQARGEPGETTGSTNSQPQRLRTGVLGLKWKENRNERTLGLEALSTAAAKAFRDFQAVVFRKHHSEMLPSACQQQPKLNGQAFGMTLLNGSYRTPAGLELGSILSTSGVSNGDSRSDGSDHLRGAPSDDADTRGQAAHSNTRAHLGLVAEHARGILVAAAMPTWFEDMAALPLTSSGKVDYAALAAPANLSHVQSGPLTWLEPSGLESSPAGAVDSVSLARRESGWSRREETGDGRKWRAKPDRRTETKTGNGNGNGNENRNGTGNGDVIGTRAAGSGTPVLEAGGRKELPEKSWGDDGALVQLGATSNPERSTFEHEAVSELEVSELEAARKTAYGSVSDEKQRNGKLLAAVLGAFRNALGSRYVASDTDFFAAGGSSVTAAELAFALRIDMRAVYERRTPAGLTSALLGSGGGVTSAGLQLERDVTSAQLGGNAGLTSARLEGNRRMVSALPERDGRMASSLPEDDPRMTFSPPEDDPQLTFSLPEEDQRMTSSLPEDDPRITSAVQEQGRVEPETLREATPTVANRCPFSKFQQGGPRADSTGDPEGERAPSVKTREDVLIVGQGPGYVDGAETAERVAVAQGNVTAAAGDVTFWDSDDEGGFLANDPAGPNREFEGYPFADPGEVGIRESGSGPGVWAEFETANMPENEVGSWERLVREFGGFSLTRCNLLVPVVDLPLSSDMEPADPEFAELKTRKGNGTGNGTENGHGTGTRHGTGNWDENGSGDGNGSGYQRRKRKPNPETGMQAGVQPSGPSSKHSLPVLKQYVLPAGPSPGRFSIQPAWRDQLGQCVDASPVLLAARGKPPRVFIGSHAHIFKCLDASTGRTIWEQTVSGRVEATAGVTRDGEKVVFGCYDRKIYVFGATDGKLEWSFQTGGEVKCQAVADPWEGFIWCGSHDHHVYVLDVSKKRAVFKHNCGGSVYGTPAFDSKRGRAYAVTTRGHVIAFDGRIFEVIWTVHMSSPLFASPAVTPSGRLLCASVDGNVTAMTSSGELTWRSQMGGPIFGGPCLSPALPGEALVCSRDGHVRGLDLETGRLLWDLEPGVKWVGEPLTASAAVDETVAIYIDGSGLEGASGGLQEMGWSRVEALSEYGGVGVGEGENRGEEMQKAADVGASVRFHRGDVQASPEAKPSRDMYRLVWVCGSAGTVRAIALRAQCEKTESEHTAETNEPGVTIGMEQKSACGSEGVDSRLSKRQHIDVEAASHIHMGRPVDNEMLVLAAVTLPGDVFSSPVAMEGSMFVGCRDDHVYALKLQEA